MSSTISSTATGSTGAALITSMGIGSGLNIGAIVSELTTAEGSAQQTQITSQETSLNAQVSAFGTFSSALATLQATLSTLQVPSELAGFNATVADPTVATASAGSDAVAGQYSLSVQNLAASATLTSAPVLNATSTAIGVGTLNIAVGSASDSITIDSTNDTLSGIADAINGAADNPGLTASIITTSDGARLVLSGTTTGAANAITVTETDGGTGLSSLVYDPANKVTNLTETQPAADANFTVNGYPATSSSNVVTSVINGVSISLLNASATTTSTATPPVTTSTPTTLNVAPNTANAATSIGTFVTALNGVMSAVQTLTGYDATTQTAGPLNGDPTLQSFQNQLENILDTVTTGSSGGAQSLSDLGYLEDATTGTYTNNSTTLTNALTSNLASVQKLLGGSTGLATQIGNLINGYTGPGGLLTTVNQGLQTGLANAATQQTQLTTELATYSATLTAQYNAMDTAVAALKQTETYLTAEFNANSTSSSTSTSSLSSGTTST
jgi:flagellar hook-associated protein 2